MAAAREPKFTEEDDISDDEEIYESLVDRMVALKEFIPESTRDAIAANAEAAHGVSVQALKWAGNAAWIVTTSMLILAVPLVLAIETEQQLDQMELERKQQLQQQRQMLNPGLYGAPTAQ